MALEIQIEKSRVIEAMSARDAVVRRLTEAHISIRQKVAIIDRLEIEKADLRRRLVAIKGPCDEEHEDDKAKSELEIEKLQTTIKTLQEEIKLLKECRSQADVRKVLSDPPPQYEEGKLDPDKVTFS